MHAKICNKYGIRQIKFISYLCILISYFVCTLGFESCCGCGCIAALYDSSRGESERSEVSEVRVDSCLRLHCLVCCPLYLDICRQSLEVACCVEGSVCTACRRIVFRYHCPEIVFDISCWFLWLDPHQLQIIIVCLSGLIVVQAALWRGLSRQIRVSIDCASCRCLKNIIVFFSIVGSGCRICIECGIFV